MAKKLIYASKLFLFSGFLLMFFSGNSFAQTGPSGQTESTSNSVTELQQRLEAELQQYLQQIDELQGKINNLQKEGKSLSTEVTIAENNIKKIQLQIKATKVSIQELDSRISDTTKAISITRGNMDKSQAVLGDSLRNLDFIEQKSLLEILLENNQLSDFFSQIVYLNNIKESMKQELDNLRSLKVKLQSQQDRFESEKDEQASLLSVQQVKNQELGSLKAGKQKLLDETKGKESNYQKVLVQTQKSANEIRAQIYRLAGGAGEITFGEALKYADLAGGSTGVRPAFLLAVLDYESKLGKNVGTCNYSQAMKPSEKPIFERITADLNLDSLKMLVSCKQWYGWGGAMGPAQFIPSTWIIYKDKVAELTGHKPPSPWNIVDAFVAAGVYLSNLGADKKTNDAEWTAAMKYFAGSNWWKKSLRFYGDDVLAIAKRYQSDIDALKQTSSR